MRGVICRYQTAVQRSSALRWIQWVFAIVGQGGLPTAEFVYCSVNCLSLGLRSIVSVLDHLYHIFGLEGTLCWN